MKKVKVGMEIVAVPVSKMRLNKDNIRREYNTAMIAASMAESGYDRAKPIKAWLQGGFYVPEDGNTRLLAAMEVGLAEVYIILMGEKGPNERIPFADQDSTDYRRGDFPASFVVAQEAGIGWTEYLRTYPVALTRAFGGDGHSARYMDAMSRVGLERIAFNKAKGAEKPVKPDAMPDNNFEALRSMGEAGRPPSAEWLAKSPESPEIYEKWKVYYTGTGIHLEAAKADLTGAMTKLNESLRSIAYKIWVMIEKVGPDEKKDLAELIAKMLDDEDAGKVGNRFNQKLFSTWNEKVKADGSDKFGVAVELITAPREEKAVKSYALKKEEKVALRQAFPLACEWLVDFDKPVDIAGWRTALDKLQTKLS